LTTEAAGLAALVMLYLYCDCDRQVSLRSSCPTRLPGCARPALPGWVCRQI